MTAPVTREQRFTRRSPCPICTGGADTPPGRGERCWGFLGGDGAFAHCTRGEHAGSLDAGGAGTFAHLLDGPCRCGREHSAERSAYARAPALPPAKVAKVAKARDRSASAAAIWRAARPAAGTPVERYLRSRSLVAPLPAALRFAPALPHSPSGRILPAMVAGVTRWPGAGTSAVHRTFLRPDGSGKADVDPARMTLGPIAGGAVCLDEPGTTLAVAEGIETALAVQLATGIPTWAALSAGGMGTVVLPPLPLAAEVLIAADGDEPGIRAAAAAADRFLAEGRRVRIARPPEGRDFNDLLRERAAS